MTSRSQEAYTTPAYLFQPSKLHLRVESTNLSSAFIGNFLFILFLVALYGFFTKLNFLYYFKIHPTLFDDEDITAMSLTVHKSLLRALNNSGIDISKLRIKQSFKGGKKDQEL